MALWSLVPQLLSVLRAFVSHWHRCPRVLAQSYGSVVRAVRELGVKETFWKIFQTRTLKFGNLVGTDALGNRYYENKKDYPYGAGAPFPSPIPVPSCCSGGARENAACLVPCAARARALCLVVGPLHVFFLAANASLCRVNWVRMFTDFECCYTLCANAAFHWPTCGFLPYVR